MDLYDKLKKYFDETPKEQVLKDWKETEIYDNVNSPTVEQLLLHNVVQAKPEKVCELIRQNFDDWVFGLETQSGEKLKVVDSTDFNDIITEIESELKDL
jgi:hypothetical protein